MFGATTRDTHPWASDRSWSNLSAVDAARRCLVLALPGLAWPGPGPEVPARPRWWWAMARGVGGGSGGNRAPGPGRGWGRVGAGSVRGNGVLAWEASVFWGEGSGL